MTILAQSGVFSWSLQWGKYGNGTITAAKAFAQVVASGTVANNNTVTAGSITYTFKTTLTGAANEVLIGATPIASTSNLAAAINAGAGIGTLYGTGTTANADWVAVAAYQTVFLTAAANGKAGNSLVLSKVGTNLSVVSPTGGYDATTYDVTIQTYHRHRAADIDYDAIQDSRIFPLEVGSDIAPTGAYKAGAFAGGGATLLPRLEDVFGDLLFATMGSGSVVNNSPVSGAHTHTIKFDPNRVESIPWVTVRKHIPGRDNVRPEGLVGIDNKVAQLRLMVPQNDILQSRIDFFGRIPQFENYSDAWLYGNTYENADKAAFSCVSSFQIPAFSTNDLPVTGAVIDIINNITTSREEMVLDSYNPDDIVVRSRLIQIRIVHKWNDPGLYQQVYTNGLAGTNWSPVPYTTNYNGGSGRYAFECVIKSTKNITGTTPYSLTVRAGTVTWQPNGPVRLVGGGILGLEYLGTVLVPDVSLGVPYAELILVNGRSSAYAIPAQP